MPRILGSFPAALVAARGGMSANAFYKELQSLGVGARRSEALAIFKIAKSVVTASPSEPFESLNSVPNPANIPSWPTRKTEGIAQNVTLTYRDKTTGEIKQTFWRSVTPNGITREAAISAAIDAYSNHADDYDQDLIGAVHTSSYNMVPFEEE